MSARALAADLARVARDLRDTRVPDLAAARLLMTAVVRRAPRRSGRLAASVRVAPASVEVTAPYGRVIDQGWPRRNISANPYLTGAPAQVDWTAPYTEHVEDALDNLQRTYREA